jgi:hypothetical protein
MLLTDLLEAALRLNTDPDCLARVLAQRKPDSGVDERILRERLALAAREIAENRHALEALRNSWSWRLTAPLRTALDWAAMVARIMGNRGRGLFRASHWSGFFQWVHYCQSIRSSHLFDDRYYLSQNRDVARLGMNPLLHYFVFGSQEHRKPNCLFDGDYYRERYPDVSRSRINPLVHYLKWGALEGRDPHPHFHSSYYLAQHPELHNEGWNPLAHFLGPGVVEGSNPNPSFDALRYLEQHPEAAGLGVNPLDHYLEHIATCSRS